MMQLGELVHNLEGHLWPFQRSVFSRFSERTVQGITADSRQVKKGFVFVCLLGEHTDGHQYIGQAIKQGAIAVVVQEMTHVPQGLLDSYPILRAESTYKVLALMASKFYDHPSRAMKLIGVTGTNGKTTVTHLIEKVLEAHQVKVGLLGTLGYKAANQADYQATSHTTPMAVELQSILASFRDEQFEAVVMEASSHALEQHRTASCDFDVAVLTNLTQDHLDYHKTMTQYFEAKALLFKGLAPRADKPKHAIINMDDEYGPRMMTLCPTNVNVITYSLTNEDASIYSKDVSYTIQGASYQCVTPKGTVDIALKIAGQFAVYNSLAAIAVGVALDIPLDTIKNALESVTSIRGRFEVVAQEPAVIVDYAHTPDGLKNILSASRIVTPEKGRLIAVFGCGGDRDASKRPQMGAIAEELADVVVITSDNPRTEDPQQIITDIIAGIQKFQSDRMIVNPDRRAAIQKAIDLAKPEDIVVVAGKGHEDYQILGTETIHFDDREEVQQYIQSKRQASVG